MAVFTINERNTLSMAMHLFAIWFNINLLNPVRQECGHISDEINNASSKIDEAKKHLDSFSQSSGDIDLGSEYLPVYKKAIIIGRQHTARSIESRGKHVHHGGIKNSLHNELDPYNNLTEKEWFLKTDSMVVPRLTNFLSLQQSEILLIQSDQSFNSTTRIYDEKFHILQAPDLFLKDLNYFRKQCDLRGSSVAAAFIDIDDFKKKFNSLHGNERIDRDVLPLFMETIESHVFGRGYAYRQGGDEYLILLPSINLNDAIKTFDDLRQKLANLEYPNIRERTTVSIGLCFVNQECFLTDSEVREKANDASKYAKEHNGKQMKNCIATYNGSRYRQEDLYVAAPVDPVKTATD